MSVVKEQEVKKRIRAKGILTEINGDGFIIEDEKDGSSDMLGFEDIEMFVGKLVNLSIMETEKIELDTE